MKGFDKMKATALAAALAVSAAPAPFALVLDDFHVLDEEPRSPLPGAMLVTDLLASIAQYATNCHLVFASRTLPTLHGLVRMVAQQRAAVFDYLSRVEHHPTAEEVFLAVKPRLPKISLATVYKNLEALVKCGMASKLTYGDGSARYDIRTDHHYHTRCLKCGSVADLDATEGNKLLSQIKPQSGFEVKDYRLELLGYCRDCR
jgi:Fe2+ or Zn2+ uptake regulation protein